MSAHARKTDLTSSHEAAASISETKLSWIKQEILAAFKTYGQLTDKDLVFIIRKEVAFEATEQNIRSRRADLTKQGLLQQNGYTKNIGNRKEALWVLA
jgi:hypothetical protein